MPELDLPPEKIRDKLPNQDNDGELFAVGGWGVLLPTGVDLNWDQPRGRDRPQMVQDDDEKARQEGLR